MDYIQLPPSTTSFSCDAGDNCTATFSKHLACVSLLVLRKIFSRFTARNDLGCISDITVYTSATMYGAD